MYNTNKVTLQHSPYLYPSSLSSSTLQPTGRQSSAAARSACSPSDGWVLVGYYVSAVAVDILAHRRAFVPGVVDVPQLQSDVARALLPRLVAFGQFRNWVV